MGQVTCNQFVIHLEEFWYQKYSSEWSETEATWNDLIEFATKAGIK